MQTVFAEKTEDRSLDDNRHIGELFFIRMYWEKGRIPSGNILYWKDAKREDAQINFTGFDGLLLYLDETCEQNGVLTEKSAGQTMPEKKTLSGDWERAGHGTDEKIGARSNLLVKGDGTRVRLVSGNRAHLGKGLSVPERI